MKAQKKTLMIETTTPNQGHPPVSVVMSVYNGEDYLAEAIDSILDQTFSQFEFIIINDGSSDGSSQILRQYAEKDARIRLAEQENTGLTVALCRGVEMSRGTFVARMDADDFSMPERLAKQVSLLESDPELAAVTCHVEHFSDDGTVSHVAEIKCNQRLIPLYNCFVNRIGGHGQVIIRRSVYDAVGGYDPSFRFAQDYDLWTRLTRHGSFGTVDDMLYRFRTGHDSISKLSKSAQTKDSLRTCRREYENLTGAPLDNEVAMALRSFWWSLPASNTSVINTVRASLAMNRVVKAFFASDPELRSEEFSVRRSIAARWKRAIKRTHPLDYICKIVLLGNMLHWGISALIAKGKYGY